MAIKETQTMITRLGGCLLLSFAASLPLASQPRSHAVVARTSPSTEKALFIHKGFADFAAGQPGDAGANVYVTRKGEVRTIHTWDYNLDGWTDIIVNNDHSHLDSSDLLIYLNDPEEGFTNLLPPIPNMAALQHTIRWIHDAPESIIQLPTLGAGRSIVMDLNKDGYPDLAFCNFVHGWYGRHFEAFIYWGGPEGFSPERRQTLPTLTALGIAAADLNGNGWPDLVLANNGYEYPIPGTADEDEESYVYWGGPDGYSAVNRMVLPTKKATDVAIADLNGNGYQDIVFTNNAPDDQSILIYWGSANGPDLEKRTRIESSKPTSLTVADLNGDGYPDILVGKDYDEPAVIYYNNGEGGFIAETLPYAFVTDAAIADLNGNGYSDLVLAIEIEHPEGVEFIARPIPGMPKQGAMRMPDHSSYFAESLVLWGGPDGFDFNNPTKLPTVGATAVKLYDLNDDGYSEIIFANRQDGETFDVPSYIYWGGPDGYAPYDRTELQGFGPMDIALVDANLDGSMDVILMNRLSGKTEDALDSIIYWGNPRGRFSPAFATFLPAVTPLGSASADLNNDGYPDIVFANQGDDAYIYWGGPEGYTPANRSTLPVRQAYTVEIADLNRDGYLDLTFGRQSEGDISTAVIFWGGPEGFDANRRRVVEFDDIPGSIISYGDVDGDGYLNMLVTRSDFIYILPGGEGNFSWDKRVELPGVSSRIPKMADLNGNGKLDIVLVNFQNERKGFVDSFIYWNGPEGFDVNNRTEIPTNGATSSAIADLNNNGILDIVTSAYNQGYIRSKPGYIYWGSEEGDYTVDNRTELPAQSVLDLFIADFDQNGFKDIVYFNHAKDNDHAFGSWIYRGSEDGFFESNRDSLPSFGMHVSRGVDIGNIRTREFREYYLSAPIKLSARDGTLSLQWDAEMPLGSSIQFQVRFAESREGLEYAEWMGPKGSGTYYEVLEDGRPVSFSGADWVQYRAVLLSNDGSNYPVLKSVRGYLK